MQNFRSSLFKTLQPDSEGHLPSKLMDIALIGLITTNVLAVILETVASLHQQYQVIFHWIEIISISIFTLEYLLRLWTCVESEHLKHYRYPRLKYILSPLALVDLVAILPFYLMIFLQLDLRFLRVLRLFRILKLTRYSSALNLLIDVIQEESRSLFAGFFIMMILLVIASCGAYLAEHQAQPNDFGSIPAAMWWAVATLTTVGYGDVTPITVAGRFFGAMVAIVGIGMAALPAGILASGMADRLRRTREEMSQSFRHALEDGIIDAHEEKQLERLRKKLGISQRIAHEIRQQVLHERSFTKDISCPHCLKSFRHNHS